MKKILVSLVLIFGLFFSFGNVNVNAQITEKEKQKIDEIIVNFLIKTEKKYGKDKTINILKKIIYKIKELEKNPKFSNKGDVLDILDYLLDKIEYLLSKKNIEKYFSLLENGSLDEAEKMIGEKTKVLSELKNLIKGKHVKISIYELHPFIADQLFYCELGVQFLENGKVKYVKNFVLTIETDLESGLIKEIASIENFASIKIERKETGRKYIFDEKTRYDEKTKKYILVKDNYIGNNKEIIPEIELKLKYFEGNGDYTGKVFFEKKGPKFAFGLGDNIENDIEFIGLYASKIFFTSNVNIINGKYIMFQNYVYDPNKNQLIKLPGKGVFKVKDGLKGVFEVKNRGGVYFLSIDKMEMYQYANISLYLLDKNNKIIKIYSDTGRKINNGEKGESLYDYKILEDNKIKLFLNNEKEEKFSKIIEVK